jgi:hypothetical protein
MLQAFNPNKNIMSTKTTSFTYKHLKDKTPSEFIHVGTSIYPSYKNKSSGGKGATLRLTFKDADGNNTGTPFQFQTPPVNLYFPNVRGTHQGKLMPWDDDYPTIEQAKRKIKFQVGSFYEKVQSTMVENKINVDKLLQVHGEWYDWMEACLDECANQIHSKATSKAFRGSMKDENVNEGVVSDLVKSVKPKTSLESFKDNFISGLNWDIKQDKNGEDIGRIIECWSKVQASRGRPTVQYPIITKKLVDEEFSVTTNVTPSDDTISKAYKWDAEQKIYSYHGNELDDNGFPAEPDIIKHNQVAVLVFEPQFYAAPVRGFKMVLKKIHIMQDSPTNKRSQKEDPAIEDEWAGCM